MQCNMLKAKSQLSKLVQAALTGEDVIIANKGVPVVRLVKIEVQHATRKPGAWAKMKIGKARHDWDAPKTNAAIADALAGDSFGSLP